MILGLAVIPSTSNDSRCSCFSNSSKKNTKSNFLYKARLFSDFLKGYVIKFLKQDDK